MLFKRKHKPHYTHSIQNFFWPKNGWVRSSKYILLRAIRIDDTAQSIALGFAAGAFVSFSPFMGFHFIIAGLLAWSLRSNVIASALGTFVGNPLTFPFIWLSTYNLGNFILMNKAASPEKIDFANLLLDKSWGAILPIVKPMLVGGLIAGLPLAISIYFIIKLVVISFRNNKKKQKIIIPQTLDVS